MLLSSQSLRVLGALIEKEIVTPDAYPLSLNALIAASNQRSSREPVTDYTEDEVRMALRELESHELVTPARDALRVAKFEHRIRTVLALKRDETALICLLMLRGAQTPGELRSRSDRMYSFEDLAQVQSALERLAAREQPLVAALPRVPGSREQRWIHLLGDQQALLPETASARSAGPHPSTELEALRAIVGQLEQRLKAVEEQMQQLLGAVADSPKEG
jgi:uncharacterized protein YceH (UPF0502 family)